MDSFLSDVWSQLKVAHNLTVQEPRFLFGNSMKKVSTVLFSLLCRKSVSNVPQPWNRYSRKWEERNKSELHPPLWRSAASSSSRFTISSNVKQLYTAARYHYGFTSVCIWHILIIFCVLQLLRALSKLYKKYENLVFHGLVRVKLPLRLRSWGFERWPFVTCRLDCEDDVLSVSPWSSFSD